MIINLFISKFFFYINFSNLKASNILIDNDATVKLIDYSIPLFTNFFEITCYPSTVNDGRYLWTAPEIVFDSVHDTRCDIWGVGCLTYELLTGFPPFYEETGGDFEKLKSIMKKKGKKIIKGKNCQNFLLGSLMIV